MNKENYVWFSERQWHCIFDISITGRFPAKPEGFPKKHTFVVIDGVLKEYTQMTKTSTDPENSWEDSVLLGRFPDKIEFVKHTEYCGVCEIHYRSVIHND